MATNSDGEEVYTPRYVCRLAELLPIYQLVFSPQYATPKKAHAKETSTPSRSIRSAFVYFVFILVLFWDDLFYFIFHRGKKRAIAITDSDNEDVFVQRYVLCIIYM